MAYKYLNKEASGRGEVKVLAETYEKGKPEEKTLGLWRFKASSRQEKLRYLQTGERYWYSRDWYGSEKRKTPA